MLQTWHPSALHVPSSVWAGGRGTGRKFPICSAPILASPFVSLAICPAAPRAPRSRCTCRKYQDGLCLCFKRRSGPRATASSAWQPQKCRGLAWPGGSAVPLPPLLSFFFCRVGVWGAQAQPCSARWVFVTSRNGATAPGKHPGGNFGGQTPAVPPAEPPPVAGGHTHTPALAPRGAAAAVPAWLQPFQPEQSPKAVSKGSCSASAPSFPFSVLSGAIIDVNSPVKGHCQLSLIHI